MRAAFYEFVVVLSHSKRTQLAIIIGVCFFFGMLLLGRLMVGGVELQGPMSPLTETVHERLMHRYDSVAWWMLWGFLLLGVKSYLKDRKRLLAL